MIQYLEVLKKIINEGVEKESGRENMPNTIGISNATISMDLEEGFPLLTTKKMFWKGIVHELLWFLRGDTNIKYLIDNNVNIWNGDAYRWYCKKHEEYCDNTDVILDKNEFISYIRNGVDLGIGDSKTDKRVYKIGDLGKVYGHQWRNQNGVDQIKEVLDGLKNNPYSRYHIIDGWNKADFPEMALPPCHLLYQFIVRPLSNLNRKILLSEKEGWENFFDMIDEDPSGDIMETCDEYNIPKFYLDLNMYQRSCDTFLGVPFNIASMSLLLSIFAKASGMIAGVANWIGGDTHLYVNHMDAVKEQLNRVPYRKPRLHINKELSNLDDILSLTIDDFELSEYKSYPSIKAELFTGIKK